MVIRFINEDVVNDMENVLTQIKRIVEQRKNAIPTNPAQSEQESRSYEKQ